MSRIKSVGFVRATSRHIITNLNPRATAYVPVGVRYSILPTQQSLDKAMYGGSKKQSSKSKLPSQRSLNKAMYSESKKQKSKTKQSSKSKKPKKVSDKAKILSIKKFYRAP
jgi:hypothetical protein